MEMTVVDRYRRWYDYERDAHAKVIASLRAVAPAVRAREEYRAAVDLLAHVCAARELWLYRFGVAPAPPAEAFPRDVELDALESRLEAMQSAWRAHLHDLHDEDIARSFEYRSLEGQPFRNTFEDILTQLFGHSWYHRGQIAARLRTLGAEPAVTDFVFWTREPL